MYQHRITSHTSKIVSFLIYNGPYITIVAPWKAKLLIWMPLQAYRFQGLEGGSETTRDVLEKEHRKHTKHLCLLLQMGIFSFGNKHIFWKKAHKNTTPRNLLIHLEDASMSTCHSKDHVQIIIAQDLFQN